MARERSILRTSPAWRAVVFDRLEEPERKAITAEADVSSSWGVLRPVGEPAGRSHKLLNHDTALLLLYLREPGPLPRYVAEEPGGERQVAELILDGVMEVSRGDGFVSGPEALPLVQLDSTVAAGSGEPSSVPARLSLEAIRWASRLEVGEVHRLASKLYRYGCIPLTPRWQRLLDGPQAVLRHLGLDDEIEELGWRRHDDAASGWISWTRRAPSGSRAPGAHSGTSSTIFKLYISPALEDLPRVAGVLAPLLAGQRATGFKLGRDALGLLRPDKIVAYFHSLDDLLAAAHALADAIDGVAPHGVPFTAAVTDDGLLSWGVDPPPGQGFAAWNGRESWRQWVIVRLATALLDARTRGDEAPWRFALERLRLDGVDVERWIPEASRWAPAESRPTTSEAPR